ncbi:MAG: hypothetical protein R6V75_09785 [Bacteroidales bacterium]
MKRTVLQMLRESAANYPKTAYTNQKGDKGWVGMTYPEVLNESRFLAAGLHELSTISQHTNAALVLIL